MLKEAVRDGRVRKVLVKYDVPVTASETMEELVATVGAALAVTAIR